MTNVELPALTAAQQAVSDRFVANIRSAIDRDGPMPFSEFMQRSLYQPGLGYYVNGFSKLGQHGDFITAPEISEHFAVCLANQCAQVAMELQVGESAAYSILEFGGGSGRLAADLLTSLEQQNVLPENYLILDVSPELQQEQRQTLQAELPAAVYSRVVWLEQLPHHRFRGVVIANEVLDAFSVERFVMVDGGAERLMVSVVDGVFQLHSEPNQDTQNTVAAIQADIGAEFNDGYMSEYCTLLAPWMQTLSECLDRGAVLICDYGTDRRQYYSEKKPTGSLRCFFRHTLHDDPFARPAVQDITADVDFTSVAIAATDVGMELQGYTPLSEFMLSLDVLGHHQNKLKTLSEHQQLAATGELKRVILSQEMGDRFMVIGFSKGVEAPLTGFSRADWSRLL